MAKVTKKVDEKDDEKDDDGANLSDLEIAELANAELRKKDAELAKVRKELAQAKLYSIAEEEETESLSREECIKRLGNNRITNYDYAKAVIALVDIEKEDGKPNPLGKNGEEVYTFLKDVLDECGDDKSRFTSIYQSLIGNDDAQIAMAYSKRDY